MMERAYLKTLAAARWWLLFHCLWLTHSSVAQTNAAPKTTNSTIVIAENPGAMPELVPMPDVIQTMVDQAILHLTGKSTVSNAWGSLVATNDVVGLKVFTAPGPNSGTRREVVAAVINGLIAAGLPHTNIVVWDLRVSELRLAGYFELEKTLGVRLAGAAEEGYDEKVYYEKPLLGTLIYSDLEFGKSGPGIGRKSYVTKLITKQLTKIINITPLLHNNVVGLTGNLYSLAIGGVDNTSRFQGSAEDLNRAVPEIWALPIKSDDDRLSDRVVLNITDALICQYEGQNTGLLHYSTPMNQLRFSRDAVALDVLSLALINEQRAAAGATLATNTADLYYNANLLELGESNPAHIRVEKLK
jgi:hypothetical protein